MNVHHDAAGLVFTMVANGNLISFEICRKAENIEHAYLRRGDNVDEFQYIPLKAVVDQRAYEGTTRFFKGPWLREISHRHTMVELADWLSQVRECETSEFYMEHFASLA
ncbi:hypothetical protein D3C85_1656440 [compost metagenome]|jgi:hypothetical protein